MLELPEPLELDVVEDDELSLEVVGEVDAAGAEDAPASAFLALPELLYRSAYQPPPFRMKPAPPDTWRFADA